MVWKICPPYSMIFSYCSIFSAGCYNLAWIHLTWRCVGFFLLWGGGCWGCYQFPKVGGQKHLRLATVHSGGNHVAAWAMESPKMSDFKHFNWVMICSGWYGPIWRGLPHFRGIPLTNDTNDWKGGSNIFVAVLKWLCLKRTIAEDMPSFIGRNYDHQICGYHIFCTNRWSRHGWGNDSCGCLWIAAITWIRIGRSIDALYGFTFMYRCILIILRDLPWLYEKFHCT